MKITIFIIGLLLSVCVFAQSDSLFIKRLDDSTLVEIRKRYDKNGRVKQISYTYPTQQEVAQKLFERADEELRRVTILEGVIGEIQRFVNGRKKYLRDSLNFNYDSIAINTHKNLLVGKWMLIKKDIVTTKLDVKVNEIVNPKRLRIVEVPPGLSGTVKIIHREKIEIINFFASEIIELKKEKEGVWRGKNGDVKYILKR